jgi:FkbM family methyltransferase
MNSVEILKKLHVYRYAQRLVDLRLRPKRVALYSQFVRPGDLCFDVGANYGNRTEILLRLGARVVAVEPQGEPFRILIERHGGSTNLVAINKGLAAKEGSKEIFLCSPDGLSSMSPEWVDKMKQSSRFPRTYDWNRSATVSVTTLDALIAAYGVPRFCKIDVEGYEYEVIQGLHSAIQTISFEHTPEAVETTLSVIDYLAKSQPYEFNFVADENSIVTLTDWLSAEKMTEYLKNLKQQTSNFGDVYARLRGKPTSEGG